MCNRIVSAFDVVHLEPLLWVPEQFALPPAMLERLHASMNVDSVTS
jgi:hypothetical protein